MEAKDFFDQYSEKEPWMKDLTKIQKLDLRIMLTEFGGKEYLRGYENGHDSARKIIMQAFHPETT